MATRRIVKTENDVLSKDNVDIAPAPSGAQAQRPVVPGFVIAKLLFFSVAMLAGPLGTYYISVTMLFKDNSTVAGALAAVAANVVLVGYIIAAMREDDPDAEEKKAQ